MSQNLSTHRHRFLVAGEIIFNQADSDVTHSVRLNAMIAHTDVNLPARLIGKAQQTLQMLLFKRMGESAEAAGIAMPQITVHDVVILNISSLGWLSEEEFNAPPEGTVQQEKPVLKVVPKNVPSEIGAAMEEADEAALHIITGAAE